MIATLTVFTGTRLPSLDGLRFFAALLVVLGHGGLELPTGDGVTYFFVLSGLLFSWMFQREWARHGRIDFKLFYLRRTFRILPAFYAAIAVTILGKLTLGLPVAYGHALAAATFTGNYYNGFHGHPPTGFDLYWSLGVEEQFYLIWPICFVYFTGRGPRALLRFLVTAVVVVCGWRSVLALAFDVPSPYLYNAFDTRFDSLALGCLLGLVVMDRRSEAWLKALTRTGLEPLLTLAAIIALTRVPDAVHHSIGFTLEAAFMGVLVVQLVVLHDHRFWRWLNHRSLVFLGALSYSTYLYHGWGLALGGKLSRLPLEARVAAGLVVALSIAYVSYRWVEQPFLRLGRRVMERWKSASAP